MGIVKVFRAKVKGTEDGVVEIPTLWKPQGVGLPH